MASRAKRACAAVPQAEQRDRKKALNRNVYPVRHSTAQAECQHLQTVARRNFLATFDPHSEEGLAGDNHFALVAAWYWWLLPENRRAGARHGAARMAPRSKTRLNTAALWASMRST